MENNFTQVRFRFCGFVESRATAPKQSSSLFSGDELFLTVKTSYIINSTFKKKKNKGSFGAVKFYNVFDTNYRNVDHLSEKIDFVIQVIDCTFEYNSESTDYIKRKTNFIAHY